jgi:hypothetical protein
MNLASLATRARMSEPELRGHLVSRGIALDHGAGAAAAVEGEVQRLERGRQAQPSTAPARAEAEPNKWEVLAALDRACRSLNLSDVQYAEQALIWALKTAGYLP